MSAAIPVRAPFPWRELLKYLSFRLIPDIEEVSESAYRRKVSSGAVTVTFDGADRLVVDTNGSGDLDVIRERVAAVFDIHFDFAAVERRLRTSRVLASRLRKVPGMRPLGTWSPFELCVRTVLGQQVTVAAAGTLMRRWMQRCGSITPECVLAADLTDIGMPSKRVETIRTLARAVLEQQVRFDAPWSEVNEALKELPGFGPWTRDYLAIRLGREPDAFPASDLGLIRAANVSSSAELLKLAERWRPYRAYAATYLWAVPV